MIHYLFHNMLQGVRPTENVLISLPVKEMSVHKDSQKMEEERLKQQRKRLECVKGVITKRKLKFDFFKMPKLLTLMTSVQTFKENIIQCSACDKIQVDPPSED
ncbi:hypothetical protein AVEN_77109-1 [Araneus ventricosus]|uniref:Uncharacterized protein n=1 Tax=Araneus ventricosus TaxID=182803 RepID=A0A4Y2QAA4_ARAVE|nr:hypothetical protein AVEN_77109-1 [Araneus ventricosus]